MKPFFKSSLMTATLVTTAIALGACSKATPEKLIVGNWNQSTPIVMDQAGTSVTMSDASVTYSADGTSKGGVEMTLGGVPADFASYTIATTGTWDIEDGFLVETVSEVDVTPGSQSPQAAAIATQMKSAMSAQPESRSEIKTLTKESLVVYQEDADLTMSYNR